MHFRTSQTNQAKIGILFMVLLFSASVSEPYLGREQRELKHYSFSIPGPKLLILAI